MNGPDDFDPREVRSLRAALDTMTPAHRAMVLRMAAMLRAAGALPARRRTRPAPVEPASPEACDDAPADDLARAEARRILTRHGRGTGGAA